jgi:tripartite ATP-independent transporter DctM subunit
MNSEISEAAPATASPAGRRVPAQSMFEAGGRAGRFLTIMTSVVEHIAGVALAADVLVVFASVICRYFLRSPINWAEEVASALIVVLVFLGAATVLARGRHSNLGAVRELFPVSWHEPMVQLCDWIIVAVSIGLLASSVYYFILSIDDTTPFGLPQWIFIGPAVVGSALMAVIALAKALSGPRKTVLWTFVGGFGATTAVCAWNAVVPDYAVPPAVLMGIGFVVPLVIGVPIAFSLAFCTLLYFANSPSLPLSIYSQALISGASHFVLLAIPFFVLAGLTMEANGMSIRLIELLLRMMGRMRGGLNIIIVVASAFFSGISGSKLADIAAVGAVVMPAVRKTGQDPNEAAGLLCATAIMSETIPPCVNMIIFAFVANISVGGLFAAGLVPAALLAVVLIAVVIYYGKRINPDEVFEEKRPLVPLIGGAMIGLFMIVMIGRGVMIGVATSTEISAFAVVYAFVVGGLAFRELTFKSVARLFVQSAAMTGAILFIVGAASSLSFSLAIEQIPQHLSVGLISFGSHYGATVFMVASAVMMIIFGSILEGAPALIIFGPLLMPIAVHLGIAPYHFGIVTVVAMGLGLCSPPLGIGVYTTCAVTETDIKDISGPMVKYLAVFFLTLLLIILVPWFSVWLPQRWGL